MYIMPPEVIATIGPVSNTYTAASQTVLSKVFFLLLVSNTKTAAKVKQEFVVRCSSSNRMHIGFSRAPGHQISCSF
jgi:hypothetical protein